MFSRVSPPEYWAYKHDCDDGGDVGMCSCVASLHGSVGLFPPPRSHPSAIDRVADYKSTASWATLQVS